MLTSNMVGASNRAATFDLFHGKSQTVQDIYGHLLEELNKMGPIRENRKSMFISLEGQKSFATVMIRNRSLKLILRTNHRITSPRIHGVQRVAEKSYEHTILIESQQDIDTELLKWLGDAYQAGK